MFQPNTQVDMFPSDHNHRFIRCWTSPFSLHAAKMKVLARARGGSMFQGTLYVKQPCLFMCKFLHRIQTAKAQILAVIS